MARETDRKNCSGSLRVTVTEDGSGGAPDLVVRSLRTNPGTLTAGATFTLSATVRNIGSGTATATTLRYYHWRSSSREWVVVGSDGVGPLSASASSPESIRLTAPSRAGTAFFNACVSFVARETDRKNCSGSLRVTVTEDGRGGAPDLVVRSLLTSPDTLTAGATFTLSATVRNIGSGTAAATTLRYYHWRSSSREWVVVGSDGVGPLSASASSPESIRLTAPSRAGTAFFNACVTSVARETDRKNCSGSLRVTVTAGRGGGVPDLVVQSLSASAASLTTGETFTLTVTVHNRGSGAAPATTVHYYRRAGGPWESVGSGDVRSLPASGSTTTSIQLTGARDRGERGRSPPASRPSPRSGTGTTAPTT